MLHGAMARAFAMSNVTYLTCLKHENAEKITRRSIMWICNVIVF